LSSCSPTFTSRIQSCDRTNIRGGAIDYPRNTLKHRLNLTATQRISVRLQIWMREVKEGLKPHNLRTDHVMIQSELIYIIGVRVTGTVKWSRGPGNKPTKTIWVGFLGCSWPGPGPSVRFQPGPMPGNLEPLLTLVSTEWEQFLVLHLGQSKGNRTSLTLNEPIRCLYEQAW